MVLLLGAGAAGAWAFHKLRVPAGVMFGAMAAGAGLFGSGTITTGIPGWIMLPGFAVIGAVIGTNFDGTDRRLLVSTMIASVGAVLVGATAAMAVALPVAWLTGLPTAQIWLSYAPGGVDAMTILALALAFEPAFVGAHHLARFLLLATVMPLWLRPYLQREGSKQR